MTDLRKVADTLEMTIPYLPAKTATLSEVEETIEELRQAFAQPEQEPVGWLNANEGVDAYAFTWRKKETHDIPLYTAPPKREWVSATHIEIGNLWAQHKEVYGFAMALDNLLKEKNCT